MQHYRVLSLCFGLVFVLSAQQRTKWKAGGPLPVCEDVPSDSGIKALAAGAGYSVLVASDGSVWTWGDNSEGQLGRRAFPSNPAPSRVEGLGDVGAVSAGHAHTLALKGNGTVWAWGRNSEGQLGDGTTTNRALPVQVLGLTGVVAVAAGASHSLAVNRDGIVFAWGSNISGQLGDGTTASRSRPAAVRGPAGVIDIAAGQAHSLAVTRDGNVWAWGNNRYGQLGDGTVDPQRSAESTPAEISGLEGITAVAAGYGHSLALKGDGTVWVWGNDGVFAILQPSPVEATGLRNVRAIAASVGTSVIVKADGTVWEWGYDIVSRSLNSPPAIQSMPAQVPELTGVAAVALAANGGHGLALKRDGTAWVWGGIPENQQGQVAIAQPLPRQIAGLSGAAAVSPGMVLKSNGTLWAWQPPFTWGWLDRQAPSEVSDITGVVAIASGTTGNTLAVTGNGIVWDVLGSWPLFSIPNLTDVTRLSAGESHALAVKRDGTVWTLSGVNSPAIRVIGLSDVSVAAVAFEWWWGVDDRPVLLGILVLKRDGSVWAWALSNRSAPARISGLDGVTAIAGGEISLALKEDGTVWQWDATSDMPVPLQVSGLTGVTAIAVGGAQRSCGFNEAHALALKLDGTVWAWGPNRFGQLGDGTTVDRDSPVQVTGLSDVIAIGAAGSSSVAVQRDGTAWGWGAGPARFGSTWSLPAQVWLPGTSDIAVANVRR